MKAGEIAIKRVFPVSASTTKTVEVMQSLGDAYVIRTVVTDSTGKEYPELILLDREQFEFLRDAMGVLE